MRQIWAIVKREYLTRVRTKGFVIGTILGPLLMAAVVAIPIALVKVEVREERRIAILDEEGWLYQALSQTRSFGGGSGYTLVRMSSGTGGIETALQKLKADVLAGRLYGVLVVPAHEDALEFPFYSRNVSNFVELAALHAALSAVVVESRLKGAGLDPARVHELTRGADLKPIRLTTGGGEKEEKGQTFVITYVLSLLLYTSLVVYGVSIMRSVIEEKSSRVIEVLLSSVSSFKMMAGKILGVGSVGLTQYLIWALFGAMLSAYGWQAARVWFPQRDISAFISVPLPVFFYFFLFFTTGYFMFAALYAAVGAAVNSEQESQQLQFMVSMFLVMPVMMTPLVLRSPNSTLSVTLSMFPLFSPVLMMMRVCVSPVPPAQIFLSVVISVVSTICVTWVVARIYRVGILMYGKRPTIVEVARWLRRS